MTPVPVHRALAGHRRLGDGVPGGDRRQAEGRQGKSSARSGPHMVGLIGEFAFLPCTACGSSDNFPNLFKAPGAVKGEVERGAGHGDAR